SCSGKLRSRIPFAFVGLIGIEKYRISALPVESFPFSSSFKASDTMAKDNGNPQYAALTAEQYHCSIGTSYPIALNAFLSKLALCACFSIDGSSKASKNS